MEIGVIVYPPEGETEYRTLVEMHGDGIHLIDQERSPMSKYDWERVEGSMIDIDKVDELIALLQKVAEIAAEWRK